MLLFSVMQAEPPHSASSKGVVYLQKAQRGALRQVVKSFSFSGPFWQYAFCLLSPSLAWTIGLFKTKKSVKV